MSQIKVVAVSYKKVNKNYIFEVPFMYDLKKGDHVRVEGSKDTVICVTDTIFVTDEQLKFLCDLNGAYLPLKKVLGKYTQTFIPFVPDMTHLY